MAYQWHSWESTLAQHQSPEKWVGLLAFTPFHQGHLLPGCSCHLLLLHVDSDKPAHSFPPLQLCTVPIPATVSQRPLQGWGTRPLGVRLTLEVNDYQLKQNTCLHAAIIRGSNLTSAGPLARCLEGVFTNCSLLNTKALMLRHFSAGSAILIMGDWISLSGAMGSKIFSKFAQLGLTDSC